MALKEANVRRLTRGCRWPAATTSRRRQPRLVVALADACMRCVARSLLPPLGGTIDEADTLVVSEQRTAVAALPVAFDTGSGVVSEVANVVPVLLKK